MMAAALLLGTPFFIAFGALSDKIGRKKVMMAGCALAILTYFPIFKALTDFANPALAAAQFRAPVTVLADPQDCSFQFNPTGTARFNNSCDIAKSILTTSSVNYARQSAAAGTVAAIKVGDKVIQSYDPKKLSAGDVEARDAEFRKNVTEAIRAAGYPSKADPNNINYVVVVLLLTILVLYVTMLYGPVAAILVELFPTRIRYTSMSLPYHIGNGWLGGFLPATAFAIVAATGDIYSGLWYPIVVASITLVIGTLFLPETRNRDIYAND
jgi:nitrate/nitrite transporter NarK